MDIQLGRSKTVRRAYGIDEIALVPGGRTVDPEVTDTRWTLGGIEREICLLYTSPSPRDKRQSRMPSSA